jgi:hypothetical protein
VELSKPGLGYIKEENRIGNRIRDWVVKAPDNGFIFPTFSNRSGDTDSLTYFTRDIKNPKGMLMEKGLGCIVKKTNEEEKISFQNIIKENLGKENKDIVQSINNRIKEISELEDPVLLDTTLLNDVLTESKVPEEFIPGIKEDFKNCFKENLPVVDSVLDKKLIKKAQEEQLSELNMAKTNSTLFINIREDLSGSIVREVIAGKESIVIPIDEGVSIKINGKEM